MIPSNRKYVEDLCDIDVLWEILYFYTEGEIIDIEQAKEWLINLIDEDKNK